MRNLLLFGPFLWLRKVVLFLLVLGVLLGLTLFFVVNSPLAIKKAADSYAGDYNISYDDIKGNAFTGIEIINPRFKNEKLAKKLLLKWNPNTLAAKTITVDKLHIEEGNVDVIKGLIASFSTEDNNTQEATLDFSVHVNTLEISTTPFVEQGISVTKAMVKSDTLTYSKDALSLKGFLIELDTNVTNIFLKGQMQKQVITLEVAQILDVNVDALQRLFIKDMNHSDVDTKEEIAAKQNPLIPKYIIVKKLKTNILPVTYEPVKIQKIHLGAKDVRFDMEKLLLENAVMDINATTNLSNAVYSGTVDNNHLLGKIHLTPNNRLYELYKIPLRKEAIGEIVVDFDASKEHITANLQAKAKQLLQNKKGEFNIDIEYFTSQVDYDVNTSHITAHSKALVNTPYAKEILLTNHFEMDDDIFYAGEIKAKELSGIDVKFAQPLQDLLVSYSGNDKSIQTLLTSRQLKGSFDSKDFKTGQIHLETIRPLMLGELVELPDELKNAKASIIVDAPIDFKNFSKVQADIKVASNVVNVDAVVGYGKDVSLKGKIDIPKDSLLKTYNQEVKWNALSPLDANVKLAKETLLLKLKAKALSANVKYGLSKGDVNGKVNLSGLVAKISGNTEQKVKIETKINSLSSLGKSIATFYTLEELPLLEGTISTTLVVDKMKTAELSLNASKLIYKADRKTKHIIKDVKLVASADASKVVLKSYKATFNKQKYFSTKAATVTLGDTMQVTNLWVNDQLQIDGNYNAANKKGSFTADAKKFHIKDKMADIQTKIDLEVGLDGDDTTVKGKVVLLKGSISPTLQGRSFATDSDIIILQEMTKKKSSPFMDNLTLSLKIETKEALRLKQKPMNIRLKPDFTIIKDKGAQMLYMGSVELMKGGTYIFQEKKFTLGKSFVYFTGDVNKPLLDIKANYKSINHLITIAVTGTPAEPNINFSSSPSLTREQILSVILFDSEAGGDTQSGNDMMKMMGGAMAKAALADVGVKVDHLAFGEGNSVEVGKKLTNKITVIYINAEVPKVKLKYQHGKRTESVIGVSEESQSVDIIYKRDF